MKRYSKERKKLRTLRKMRVRQNIDRINTDFFTYFTKIDDLNESLANLINIKAKDSPNIFEAFFKTPSEIALIDSIETQIDRAYWYVPHQVKSDLAQHCFWQELSHRMQVVSESNSPLLLFESYKRSVSLLNQRLRKLRQELRRNYSDELLVEIGQLVAEIRHLASEAHEDYKLRSRTFHSKLFSLKRDLRYIFRQIVRFLFKNLDDEAENVNTVFIQVRNERLLTFKKITQDEFKEKAMDRFYKRCA